MQTTPFVGLSVFIHLLVILWCKVFRYKHTSDTYHTKTIRFLDRFSSALIVFSVFMLTVYTGGMLLVFSIKDENSLVHYAKKYITQDSLVYADENITNRGPTVKTLPVDY
ncbi:MAG: hypothetical protein M3Q34_00775 [bacterium]|nr:hypothetical protein [bacterium]